MPFLICLVLTLTFLTCKFLSFIWWRCYFLFEMKIILLATERARQSERDREIEEVKRQRMRKRSKEKRTNEQIKERRRRKKKLHKIGWRFRAHTKWWKYNGMVNHGEYYDSLYTSMPPPSHFPDSHITHRTHKYTVLYSMYICAIEYINWQKNYCCSVWICSYVIAELAANTK